VADLIDSRFFLICSGNMKGVFHFLHLEKRILSILTNVGYIILL